MEIAISYMAVYLLEAFTIKQYCSVLFVSKHSKKTEHLVLLILYSILYGISFMENSLLNIVSFLLSNLIFIFFSFNIKFLAALFHSAIATISMLLSELIIVGFVSNLASTYYDSDVYLKNTLILLFTSKPVYFFSLYLISHTLIKRPNTYEKNTAHEIILFSLIPSISLWIASTFLSICCYTKLPATINRMVTVSSILLLMANFVIYGIYTYSNEKNRQFTDLQLQLQKESDSVSYYKMLLAHDEAQNVLIHDIKKHLQAIALLNEQGEKEKIASYIDRLADSSDLQTASRICDHEFLNAILCRYMLDCAAQSIAFHTDIRSGTLNFIAENDLTSLFCNLLDNAVKAAAKQSGAQISLVVTHMPQAELTVITLLNSCRTNPFQKNGRLVSTKKDGVRHGYGLKSVRQIVQRYHGNMELYYDEDEKLFHTILTLKDTG